MSQVIANPKFYEDNHQDHGAGAAAGNLQPATFNRLGPRHHRLTCQGRLNDGATPAQGIYDLRFTIYDAATNGNAVSVTLTNTAAAVTNLQAVTAVNTGAGLTGGPITSSGTLLIANGGVANSMPANSSLTITAGTRLSGGGTIALGSSTSFSNAGVLSLTGNSDITVSPSSGNANLSTTAASANNSSTIVKRDASGNFNGGSITVSGNLYLPAATANNGIIYAGTTSLINSDHHDDFFAGFGAGNFSTWGGGSVGVGAGALRNVTNGYDNTALGNQALLTNNWGYYNIASGYRGCLPTPMAMRTRPAAPTSTQQVLSF